MNASLNLKCNNKTQTRIKKQRATETKEAEAEFCLPLKTPEAKRRRGKKNTRSGRERRARGGEGCEGTRS